MHIANCQIYQKDMEIAICNSVGIEQIKNKKVLVTGATGTIGSFIVDMLMHYNAIDNAEVTVFAAGRSIERLANRFDCTKTNKLIYVEYDLNKKIEFDHSVDYIIHAAGNAHPIAFNSDPVGTLVGNVAGTFALLEYGRTHGAKRFLYVSSGEVYGQGELQLEEFEEDYCGYIDSLLPRACYPLSKRSVENLCVSFGIQYGLETVIVRPCHTYGPGMTENDSRANAQFFRNVLKNEDIILKSDGKQMRSYCYIADCVSAMMTVLVCGNSGEAYNTVNPQAKVTIANLANIIAEEAGRKVIYAAPTASDIANRTPIAKQVLSSKKIESLGWKGHYSIRDGVRNTLNILKYIS